MKKFISLVISLVMVFSILICSVTSASAAVGIDFNATGSITLDKFVPTTDGSEPTEKVTGATFTAYRVFNLLPNSDESESADEGTFKATPSFESVAGLSDLIIESPVATGNASSQGGMFTDTDKVEELIPTLVTRSKAVKPETVDENGRPIISQFAETAEGVYSVDNLPLGVYLIVETVAPKGYNIATSSFLVSIPEWDKDTDAWNYDITATPKDDIMDIEKLVRDNHADSEEKVWCKGDSYTIGEKVEYKVTSKIPNYGMSTLQDKQLTDAITDAQYLKLTYLYTDTFEDSLTFNYDDIDDMVIYIKPKDTNKAIVPLKSATMAQTKNSLKARGDATSDDETKRNKPDFKLTKTETGFTIKIAWEALNRNQGDDLVLEYSATINEKAVIGEPINNKIELDFTNNPEMATEDVIEDDVDIGTYEMHLDKLFNNMTVEDYKNSESTFDPTAVTFKISTSANDTYLKVNKVADGSYYVWDTTENTDGTDQFSQNTAQNGTAVEEMNVDADGKLILKGLKSGTYYLEETKPVDGFGKLKNKVKVEIETAKDTENNYIIYDCNAQSYTNEGAVLATLPKFKTADNTPQDGTFVITVNNTKSQFHLPVTGGFGLWLFSITSSIIMAGGIMLFTVVRKKKTAK